MAIEYPSLAIESGIYVKGADAMNLEDNILITENGCEILSRAPKTRFL